MRPIRVLFFLAVALTALAGCEKKKTGEPAAQAGGAAATETILFGHVASLTGSEATFGDSSVKGVRLAIDEVNLKGGVRGKRIKVKVYDSQGKPEESAQAAMRLVVQDKVTVLLGENASSRSLAMAPIADANRTPMISPSSTNPKVTKDGDKTRPYVFRVCFIDPFQGTVMAKFAREQLKLDRVAVLRDVGNDYSVGLADYFVAKYEELGGAILADESFKAGDQDFKAQLTAIRTRDPQAIYIPGYYTDVALIALQARELGITVPLMGGDGWDSPQLDEIAGKALEGAYYSNHYSPEDPGPRIQEFVTKFRTHYGQVPDGLAAQGYDAASIAVDAIGRAKDLSGEAIREALAATKDYPGVTGIISIDAHHNAVKPAVVLRVEKGREHYVATIHPDPPAGQAAAK